MSRKGDSGLEAIHRGGVFKEEKSEQRYAESSSPTGLPSCPAMKQMPHAETSVGP